MSDSPQKDQTPGEHWRQRDHERPVHEEKADLHGHDRGGGPGQTAQHVAERGDLTPDPDEDAPQQDPVVEERRQHLIDAQTEREGRDGS